VQRAVQAGYSQFALVGAIIEVSLANGISVSTQQTTTRDMGLQDLSDAISNELDKLPWIMTLKPVKAPPSSADAALQRLLELLGRFHLVARQLRIRHDGRPSIEIKDEYDTQDVLRALLWSMFDQVRKEESTPSYAGRSSRMDFLLKEYKVVVEVKFATNRLRGREIADQLFIDIKRYQAHADCKTLVCFVYDPDTHIDDPAVLDELSRKHDDLAVHVVVAPRHQ
jgi:hypothetical protein